MTFVRMDSFNFFQCQSMHLNRFIRSDILNKKYPNCFNSIQNFLSLCDGARNEIRERCLSFDTTFVYFGFVDVHCQVNRFLRIRNRSNKNLNLLIQLKSNNKDSVFRVIFQNCQYFLVYFLLYFASE